MSDMDEQKALWTEYFEQLYMVDPPGEQLPITGLQIMGADIPIDETPPSVDEIREAVVRLMGGKVPGVCSINAKLLQTRGAVVTRRLHVVLAAVWQSGIIPSNWTRGLVIPT